MYPVTGQVTYAGGKPLTNATIYLHPKEPGGREAHGKVDGNGEFKIISVGGNAGTTAGKYVVTIEPFGKVTDYIPPDYQSAQKSPVLIEVKAGDNKLDPIQVQ